METRSPFLDAQLLQDVGELVHFAVHVEVGVDLPVIGVVAFEDDRRLGLLRLQVPVQTVVADIQLSAFKPFHVKVLPSKDQSETFFLSKGLNQLSLFSACFAQKASGFSIDSL